MSMHRGFTLLISIILTSVILSVGAALFDITYKQVVLSETAQQSQIAFYNADSALECGLYQDQHLTLFDYTSEPTSGSFMCQGKTITYKSPAVPLGQVRTTSFSISCDGGDQNVLSNTIVTKQVTGATAMYANGFNSCNSSDTRRIERGEKVTY
jgi:Tfp pilus assembly protein PilX